MNNRTIEIQVFGRVQGVDFRRSAGKYAESLRLTGQVENLKDGSVKLIAQGPEKNIEELLKWCQRGSILAKVEGMSYKWLESDKEYKEFEVIRDKSFIKDQVKSFLNLGKKIKHDLFEFDDSVNIPEHVVIIMNGNRKWSKQNGLKPWEGYWHVQKKINGLIDEVRNLDIKNITLWAFSTENWKRDKQEVEQLIKLYDSSLDKFRDKFINEKIRFRHIGRKDRIPEDLVKKIKSLEEDTKDFERSVNIAFDYGGRDEIMRAVDAVIKSGKKKVTEEEFSNLLYTAGLPDPDLIIRNSGEYRLSGMMPWQSVYAEFYTTNVYFPDFGPEHLREAILDFSSRKRTFGGDKDKHAKDSSKEKSENENIDPSTALAF